MKTGLTEIACILDRSGSMGSIIDEAIGGLNTFLDDQKAEDGDANITIALFDDLYQVIYDNVDLKTIPKITRDLYNPRGMTALYDAIGKTMTSIGERLAKTAEEDRPEKVMIVILTDGQENNSREYSASKIAEMITHQESTYNWTFMFLAANQDACSVGKSLGMKDYSNVNFNATAGGTRGAFTNMSSMTKSYRSMSVGISEVDKSEVLLSVAKCSFVDADGN
jgi:uncharacterized protein YegL